MFIGHVYIGELLADSQDHHTQAAAGAEHFIITSADLYPNKLDRQLIMSLGTLGGFTTPHITAGICTLCVPQPLGAVSLSTEIFCAAPSKTRA